MGVEGHEGAGHDPRILAVPRPRRPGRWSAVGRYAGPVLSLAVAGVASGLISRLPTVLDTTWTAIVLVLRDVPPVVLVALAAVWLAGMLTHTVVQVAALPGLSARRALLLNFTGSAVSDVLPFGGAAGAGLGYVMARRWRIEPDRFTAYTAVTNLWNAAAKGVAGAGCLLASLALGLRLPPSLHGPLLAAAVTTLLVVGAVTLVLTRPRVGALVGAALDLSYDLIAARVGSTRRGAVRARLDGLRATTSSVVRSGWGRLSLGMVAYLGLQALLLGLCLAAVGAHAPWTVVVAAFAVERMLTLVPITPGGVGFVELGAVGILTALNTDPVGAAAGVLLYRLFTFFLEIPVGGLSMLVWFSCNRFRAAEDRP